MNVDYVSFDDGDVLIVEVFPSEFPPTKLYQYSDRLEITNAGGLYGNACPENFPNVNDYRNPIVAEALRVLGYVNKFNRGIAMVQRSCRKMVMIVLFSMLVRLRFSR